MYYYDNYLFFLLNNIPKETDMYQVHFVKTLSACAIVIMRLMAPWSQEKAL